MTNGLIFEITIQITLIILKIFQICISMWICWSLWGVDLRFKLPKSKEYHFFFELLSSFFDIQKVGRGDTKIIIRDNRIFLVFFFGWLWRIFRVPNTFIMLFFKKPRLVLNILRWSIFSYMKTLQKFFLSHLEKDQG